MAKIEIGKLLYKIGVDKDGKFDATLKKTETNVKKLGVQMSKTANRFKEFGRRILSLKSLMVGFFAGAIFQSIVRGITSIIKVNNEYERSLNKMVGLVGLQRKEVDGFRKSIKEISVSTGRELNDLAEAMFFITSAGIRGSKAIEVLESSAKAASAGLKDTKLVADLVTSAMNAYGDEVLSAEKATDILVKTIKEGKAEPEDLASSMGQVLPIASELGVGFDQVGAAIAGMTRTGTNAQTASIQLRQILASLVKPSKQAEDTLLAFGTSSEIVRKQLREEGFLSTLSDLKDRFGDNEQAMSLVFGNIRALSGVFDLLGSNIEDNAEIFDSLADSTGALNTAFEETEDGQRVFDKLLATFNSLKVSLGQKLKASNFISKLTKALSYLDENLDKVILNFKLFFGVITSLVATQELTSTFTLISASIVNMGKVSGVTSKSMVILRGAFIAVRTAVMSLQFALGAIVGVAVFAAIKIQDSAKKMYEAIEDAHMAQKSASDTEYKLIKKSISNNKEAKESSSKEIRDLAQADLNYSKALIRKEDVAILQSLSKRRKVLREAVNNNSELSKEWASINTGVTDIIIDNNEKQNLSFNPIKKGTSGNPTPIEKAVDKNKEKIEEWEDAITSARKEATKTAEKLSGELKKSFEDFTNGIGENLDETSKGLADIVIEAEKRRDEIKDAMREDGADKKALKEELSGVQEILDARENFEKEHADKLLQIRSKLEQAGIDPDSVGITGGDSSLEEDIAEKRRVAGLDEFTRFKEQQFAKLDILTSDFITEKTMYENKINHQKQLETGFTKFMQQEISTRNQAIQSFKMGDYASPSGVTSGANTGAGSSTTNNNVNVNANIGGTVKEMTGEELSAIMSFEMNKHI